MPLQTGLEIRLYDGDLSSPTLIEELTDRVEGLSFSTALNGGFKLCQFRLNTTIGEAWMWLSRDGKKGYHFNRLTIHEGTILVWEGRIIDIGLDIGGSRHNLNVTAQGYWGATRDRLYSDDDGSRTDWTSGSGHQIDDIIKEILTSECPDINSDQSNIAAGSRDLVGINLSSREYPQHYINCLTEVSDDDGSVWFFAIWDNRIPYLFKRAATTINWFVWLSDLHNLRLQQSASQLRNAVIPVVGGTEGTTQTHAVSLALYPRREIVVTMQTGTNANTQADSGGMKVTEKALPRQQQGFAISGRIYSALVGDAGGQLAETPLWRVRAGEVIRIQDLVPSSAATPALDDLRTFYIMGTNYDADNNTLTLQPDRRGRRLSSIIASFGAVEH